MLAVYSNYLQFMGYVNTIIGKVEKGEQFGQEIGYPTINICSSGIDMNYGVYVSKVFTNSGEFWGALHYGPKSFCDDDAPKLEVHLLGFKGDLYGQEVKIEVCGKIRDVENFKSFDELKKQIASDIIKVKKVGNITEKANA